MACIECLAIQTPLLSSSQNKSRCYVLGDAGLMFQTRCTDHYDNSLIIILEEGFLARCVRMYLRQASRPNALIHHGARCGVIKLKA